MARRGHGPSTFAWPAPPQPYGVAGTGDYPPSSTLFASVAPAIGGAPGSGHGAPAGGQHASALPSGPQKRRRIVGEQLETLIAAFEVDDTPNAAKREALAAQLGMTCVLMASRYAS